MSWKRKEEPQIAKKTRNVRFTPTRAADWTGRLCEIAGYKSPGSLVNHSLSYIGRRR